ncbi:MAG: hypothetical protein V4617_19260 [Gemmatimonadota bacterium]
MPFAYTLDQSRRIVRSRAWGAVDVQDLSDHLEEMRALFADGTLDGRWRQLADFSGAESFEDVSTSGIRHVAAFNPWPPTSRRVILAPQPEAYGLARMYQLLLGADDNQLTIVRAEDEAQALLNLPDAARIEDR